MVTPAPLDHMIHMDMPADDPTYIGILPQHADQLLPILQAHRRRSTGCRAAREMVHEHKRRLAPVGREVLIQPGQLRRVNPPPALARLVRIEQHKVMALVIKSVMIGGIRGSGCSLHKPVKGTTVVVIP